MASLLNGKMVTIMVSITGVTCGSYAPVLFVGKRLLDFWLNLLLLGSPH
jgi:hypothetical protein